MVTPRISARTPNKWGFGNECCSLRQWKVLSFTLRLSLVHLLSRKRPYFLNIKKRKNLSHPCQLLSIFQEAAASHMSSKQLATTKRLKLKPESLPVLRLAPTTSLLTRAVDTCHWHSRHINSTALHATSSSLSRWARWGLPASISSFPPLINSFVIIFLSLLEILRIPSPSIPPSVPQGGSWLTSSVFLWLYVHHQVLEHLPYCSETVFRHLFMDFPLKSLPMFLVKKKKSCLYSTVIWIVYPKKIRPSLNSWHLWKWPYLQIKLGKLRWNYPGLRVDPKFNNWYLYKKKGEYLRQRHVEKKTLWRQAETGIAMIQGRSGD